MRRLRDVRVGQSEGCLPQPAALHLGVREDLPLFGQALGYHEDEHYENREQLYDKCWRLAGGRGVVGKPPPPPMASKTKVEKQVPVSSSFSQP
jgi:hypothetical protein